ncbi:GNAT family N-acetyltransferase [Gordoniibacillus kamchatkensis]|uniref:GNAT family N-acetyltransferase n=1 Tax=Gordoniibacillus kamchatkensis TaxID=1590651 RepID=UPI00373AF023
MKVLGRILHGWLSRTTGMGRLLVHGLSPGGTRAYKSASQNRSAHAALVYGGSTVVDWCQFGPPDELPRIKHKREYVGGLTKLPVWRIACFFVDRDYRGKGFASIALESALSKIADSEAKPLKAIPMTPKADRFQDLSLPISTISIFER